MEENEKEKVKEQIDIEFSNKNADPENNENAIDFRWSGAQEEDSRDIASANFIESFQKQADYEIFTKITGGLFDYYYIISKEKQN